MMRFVSDLAMEALNVRSSYSASHVGFLRLDRAGNVVRRVVIIAVAFAIPKITSLFQDWKMSEFKAASETDRGSWARRRFLRAAEGKRDQYSKNRACMQVGMLCKQFCRPSPHQ